MMNWQIIIDSALILDDEAINIMLISQEVKTVCVTSIPTF